jgi:hypothetical protein
MSEQGDEPAGRAEEAEEANPALGCGLEEEGESGGGRSWDDRPSRELCDAFSAWHWQENCFHDHVRARPPRRLGQTVHRHRHRTAGGGVWGGGHY